ncbi:MAG: hypothetical protein IPN29_06135 [Saprospiraceae bacterium]|nr:hypothetical protein [Saprospiraceae bacterium]
MALAQSGVTLFGGVTYARSPDLAVTPTGTGHYGYVTGMNIRLFDDGMHFLFSGEFGKFNLAASEKQSFFADHSLTFIKGKFGLGFDVIKLSKKSKLRTKIQGNIMYINDFKTQAVGASTVLREGGYNSLNEAIGGISTGAGFTYGILDIDFEYEYGIYNIYYARHLSRLNFMSLTTGIRF